MAHVSTYLNFDGNTAEAFEFYRSVFKTEYVSGIVRMGELPPTEGQPPVPDHLKDLVMNVQLPITGGHILMGTDAVPEWGHKLEIGNNVHIMLHVDSRQEADNLFAALSDGGQVDMPMSDQFWGDYFGDCVDRYGVKWMIVHSPV